MTWPLTKCNDPTATLHGTVVSMPINQDENLSVDNKIDSGAVIMASARRRGSIDSTGTYRYSYGPENSSSSDEMDEQEGKQFGSSKERDDEEDEDMDFYQIPSTPQECDVLMLFADNRKTYLKSQLSDSRRDVVQTVYLKTELAAVRKRLEELLALKLEMLMKASEAREERIFQRLGLDDSSPQKSPTPRHSRTSGQGEGLAFMSSLYLAHVDESHSLSILSSSPKHTNQTPPESQTSDSKDIEQSSEIEADFSDQAICGDEPAQDMQIKRVKVEQLRLLQQKKTFLLGHKQSFLLNFIF